MTFLDPIKKIGHQIKELPVADNSRDKLSVFVAHQQNCLIYKE